MRTVSFCHADTGLFNGRTLTVTNDDAIALNTPPDHIAVEGRHDHLSKRVDIATGQVIDYEPPAPSEDHEWNTETKRWQLSAAVEAKAQARAAAAARIAELEASQHSVVRDLLLGGLAARPRLQAIADEIAKLNADL
jgi:hypothetical protein